MINAHIIACRDVHRRGGGLSGAEREDASAMGSRRHLVAGEPHKDGTARLHERPTGRLSRADSPAGTDTAGKPARFTGTVNKSFRYIATGSSAFSPIGKAG